VSEFAKLIASVRDALEHRGAPIHDGAGESAPAIPPAETTRRVELISRFGRELEVLGGRFLGTFGPSETPARIAEVAASLKARTAAVGVDAAIDPAPIAAALERRGIRVIRTAAAGNDDARAATRKELTQADLGVVDASCAIAATGTLAIVATAARPSSLTLLPPVNIITVNADRMVANLASALTMLGTETIASHRVALVTGPSRTADIEKRIVLGVHGPRELYVAVVWNADD
jgi:L-lactate dehydrogenase complex protein LldG